MSNPYDVICDDIAKASDEIAQLTFAPGTIEHRFQQELIAHVKVYREQKERDANQQHNGGCCL